MFLELRLPPKPTTTPTPYIHTTSKPRKSQKAHHNKANHDAKNSKDILGGPNQLREDVSLASEGIIIFLNCIISLH